MAIDNRLQVFNEEGQSVDYDILASDVKFLPDGKDLPTKLAEMDAEIENAGGGEGTVTGVKVGSNTYEPTEGVVDLSTPFSGKVDKETGKSLMSADEHTKLQNLPTADQLTQQLGTKANSSDLQNYATKNELTQGLSGKQNTLTFDTTPTAGHTTQVMSSDSIKTALDEKADADSVPTKTEMSDAIDDALGEAQVTVVPAGSVGVIDSMGSDSTTDALSANMGKRFKAAILTLLGSMGNYCFPGGKPQLILDGSTSTTFSVTYSTSDLHVTYADGQGGTAPTTVDLLGRLEIQLGTNDDLYVINESAVKVFVGGTEVANAYDPTTDKIIIPEVYGNVVIIAEAWTYVSRGLVLHLDGRNRGGTAGKWKSLVNYNNLPLYFKLENCDESNSDYVGFDKDDNSCGIAYSDAGFQSQLTLLDVPAASGTIEFAATGMDEVEAVCIMHNNIGQGNRILFSINKLTNDSTRRNVAYCTSPLSTATNGGKLYATGVKQGYFSALSNSVKVNGVDIEMYPTDGTGRVSFYSDSSGYLALLMRHTQTGTPVDIYYSANLYALRVYSEQLTDVERAQNLAIDRKRFNLGY